MSLAPIPTNKPAATAARPIQAPNVILMGPPGSGKTWSISTLIKAGIEVFMLATEPNAVDTVIDALTAQKLPIDKFHYHYVAPAVDDWAGLTDLAKQINTQTFELLSSNKAGIAKAKSNAIMDLLLQCQNFQCQRDGKSYGDVTQWDDSRALVLDSLSGLNELAKQNTVGLKPTMAMGEWGVAMNLEEMFINKLTSDMRAYFVLIAHIDRNFNEATGQTIVTPAALGSKLGPKLGRFFSEVVMTIKDGDKFKWSTMEKMADVKQRSLPISAGLEPSFAPIVLAHQNRRKATS